MSETKWTVTWESGGNAFAQRGVSMTAAINMAGRLQRDGATNIKATAEDTPFAPGCKECERLREDVERMKNDSLNRGTTMHELMDRAESAEAAVASLPARSAAVLAVLDAEQGVCRVALEWLARHCPNGFPAGQRCPMCTAAHKLKLARELSADKEA